MYRWCSLMLLLAFCSIGCGSKPVEMPSQTKALGSPVGMGGGPLGGGEVKPTK